MSIGGPTILPLASPAERRVGEAPSEAERLRLAQVAQEFEAMLMLQMVRQMRQSLLAEDGDDGDGLGRSVMTDTIDVELARHLAAAGGLGLARSIEDSLRQVSGYAAADTSHERSLDVRVRGRGPVSLPVRSVGEATPAMSPSKSSFDASAAGVDTSLRLPLGETLSSAFGWRRDPFHGHERFHGGIDIAAAYGRPVPTAGPGRVVFAGERGAYGLMVAVEHDNGVTTRYAHLSSIDVAVGQQLAQEQVVGRVGQTGRATGPHLHFEVLVDGQRVDPVLVAEGRVPGLKSLASGVDYPIDRGLVSATPAIGDDHED